MAERQTHPNTKGHVCRFTTGFGAPLTVHEMETSWKTDRGKNGGYRHNVTDCPAHPSTHNVSQMTPPARTLSAMSWCSAARAACRRVVTSDSVAAPLASLAKVLASRARCVSRCSCAASPVSSRCGRPSRVCTPTQVQDGVALQNNNKGKGKISISQHALERACFASETSQTSHLHFDPRIQPFL